MIRALIRYSDREVINKCGLDAYFFLRYLKTLLVIFVPICAIVLPVLIPINFIGGRGNQINIDVSDQGNNSTPTGLDTLAWQNVSSTQTGRYTAHLVMAILVVVWVCTVFFFELRVYIKVRQDYLTSAEHRLRASATTVFVGSIPQKWLSEEALYGLFDVFPGGVRNIWLNRDLTTLLDKISQRDKVHLMLETAETTIIRDAKRAQLKQRDAQEKQMRRERKLRAPTKEEKAARDKKTDAEAQKLANSDAGTDSGNQNDIPHTVAEALDGARMDRDGDPRDDCGPAKGETERGRPKNSNPLSKVGKGLRGAAASTGRGVNGTLGANNGFVDASATTRHPVAKVPESGATDGAGDDPSALPLSDGSFEAQRPYSQPASTVSDGSSKAIRKKSRMAPGAGNATRAMEAASVVVSLEPTKFWQFWKPPSGSYASPVPQGAEARQVMAEGAGEKRTLWQSCTRILSCGVADDEEAVEYPMAYNPDYEADQDGGAEWEKYLKPKDRPTHRLPVFGVDWLPGLPLITKKVDTIYWCRKELARLNLEIEEDQKHPERFPPMPSAFIQFNHQVAAHMACQSVVHHLPRQMSPRMSEISPRDVIWGNMAINWWQEWLRSTVVVGIVLAMIFLWAIPVAWTAALSQIDKLIEDAKWAAPLRDNATLLNIIKGLAGVLPAATLALLLLLVPLILNFLAGLKGAKTGAQKNEFVQIYYFVFLFLQVFLVVSIASFFARSITDLIENVKNLQSVTAVLNLLADNLPGAANYFYSYMVLQALSTSSGTLLQVGALLMWFVIAPIFDDTARSKWARNTSLNQISWGAFFPVYTNFACIGLVYCVISPFISVFAVITFSLLWLAQRYAMLYVTRFELDTGGVLYPRAINQTFTGIYFMELCMAGLFFIVTDTDNNRTCTAHGIIMLVVLALTISYQVVLNISFSPLFRYLPITYEDEAVLRDEAFQRAQDARFGVNRSLSRVDEGTADGESLGEKSPRASDVDGGIEMQDMEPRATAQGLLLRNHVKQVGDWAKGGGRQVGSWAKDGGHQLKRLKDIGDNTRAARYRREQRQRDLESQQAIGNALFGGIHDDIEDLTPEERDMLTRHAFQHYALRARRPTVWIPRDDLGISEDEIRRTREFSEHIWISDEGTALDSKVRVVYAKNPPDFSEVDIINL